ncbi:hypothetical protein N302_05806, partial [Corvus brachyrhynchos]
MIPPMMSPTNINKQLSGTTEGSLLFPSHLILSGGLTYLSQGCQHDPERDFKGHLDVLVIQREERVLRGVVALGFLGSPADVLQDHVWLLQGSHPGGLEDAGEPGASQDRCSSVSLALHVPGSRWLLPLRWVSGWKVGSAASHTGTGGGGCKGRSKCSTSGWFPSPVHQFPVWRSHWRLVGFGATCPN